MKHVTCGETSDPLPENSVAHIEFVAPADGVRESCLVQAEVVGIPEDFALMAFLFERLLGIFELARKLRGRGADPDNSTPPPAKDGELDPNYTLLIAEQGEARRLIEQLQAKTDKLKNRGWLDKALAQMPDKTGTETATPEKTAEPRRFLMFCDYPAILTAADPERFPDFPRWLTIQARIWCEAEKASRAQEPR